MRSRIISNGMKGENMEVEEYSITDTESDNFQYNNFKNSPNQPTKLDNLRPAYRSGTDGIRPEQDDGETPFGRNRLTQQ